ncbi:MAG: hypothetical protein K5656_08150 [Lachnospiraceae bacterium]|nr:hypothetical protein [Lachnospiraceae bacterium]
MNNKKLYLKSIVIYLFFAAVISKLLYDNFIAIVPLLIAYPIFLKWMRNKENEKRQERISKEFIVFLTSLSGALSAGYAFENTVEIIANDLKREYPDNESILEKECLKMQGELSLKLNYINVISDMAKRLGNKDIIEFANCLSLAKSLGGNVIEMINLTLSLFRDRIETNEEIKVLISAKKLEKNIMLMVPFGMIVFLRISNPEYLDSLYNNAFGVIVMTVCLIVIVISFVISEKIVNIKV